MIDKKYPKTAEDFEKWLNKQYILWNVNPKGDIYYEHDTGGCLYLEDEMQASVYLKYFDEYEILMEIWCNEGNTTSYSWHLKYINQRWEKIGLEKWQTQISYNFTKKSKKGFYNTRILALKAAIQKASEVREKQLKDN